MTALKVEEAYHEETLNRRHCVEDLSSHTVIECTRLLAAHLQVHKGKAKALVGEAREVRFRRIRFVDISHFLCCF
jgi:hypothetical protein